MPAFLSAQYVRSAALVMLSCSSAFAQTAAFNPEKILSSINVDTLTWQTQAPYGQSELRIVNDQGLIIINTPLANSTLRWNVSNASLPDGLYHYELILSPPGPLYNRNQHSDALPRTGGRVFSGDFSIAESKLVLPTLESRQHTKALSSALIGGHGVFRVNDVVEANNEIIQGNLCVGFDCIDNESFGFDTFKLKENNTRLTFVDTSAAAPDNGWEINANDSSNGGANYLGIASLGAAASGGNEASAKQVRFNAGAPANSLFVGSNGRVGLGTSTPVMDLHIVRSVTPGIRFDQNNASGFTPQIWDVLADNTGWRLSDATNGNAIPFAIAAGAPQSSIDIAGTGYIGLSTPRPLTPLHVFRVDENASARIEETNVTTTERVLAKLVNNGSVQARLAYSDSADWITRADNSFTLTASGNNTAFSLDASGNLSLTGTLSQGSSRSLKHAIHSIGLDHTMQLLRDLPIYTWQYLTDHADVRHIGPMAEDVHARFHLGESSRALAPGDMAGLAVAATQALNKQLAEKDAELDRLIQRLDLLEHQLGIRGSTP